MELWYTEEHTPSTRFSIKVRKQLFSEKSPFQQIDIFDSEEFGRFFTLDGLMMLTEKDEFIYHDMIVHVPMATNPKIKRVLVIGGGDGGTVRELTRYKTIEKIDIDELVVRTCMKLLPFTACELDDPRVSLHFEDGLKFVRTVEEKYDLIIVDSTDPFGPGEGLFTKEFYGNCFKRQPAREPLLRVLLRGDEARAPAHRGLLPHLPRLSGAHPDVPLGPLALRLRLEEVRPRQGPRCRCVERARSTTTPAYTSAPSCCPTTSKRR